MPSVSLDKVGTVTDTLYVRLKYVIILLANSSFASRLADVWGVKRKGYWSEGGK